MQHLRCVQHLVGCFLEMRGVGVVVTIVGGNPSERLEGIMFIHFQSWSFQGVSHGDPQVVWGLPPGDTGRKVLDDRDFKHSAFTSSSWIRLQTPSIQVGKRDAPWRPSRSLNPRVSAHPPQVGDDRAESAHTKAGAIWPLFRAKHKSAKKSRAGL